jgi:hypothetical protein
MPGWVARKILLKPCTLSEESLVQIFDHLVELTKEAAEIEVAGLVKIPSLSDSEFDDYLAKVRSSYAVSVVVTGAEGETRVENEIKTALTGKNSPGKIANVYFENGAKYRAVWNGDPPNNFHLNIDFTKPPLLDWRGISQPTPNQSEMSISGHDSTWVSAVSEKIVNRLNQNLNGRKLIHSPFSYDFFLIVLGLPAAIYASSAFGDAIQSLFNNSVVIGAAHFYIGLVVLLLYRILHGYAKWAFPKVEFAGGNAGKHRGFFTAIIVSVIGAAFWDVLR